MNITRIVFPAVSQVRNERCASTSASWCSYHCFPIIVLTSFPISTIVFALDSLLDSLPSTINLIPNDIELTQKNGEFEATIDLGGFSSQINEGGIDYSCSITTSLLLIFLL